MIAACLSSTLLAAATLAAAPDMDVLIENAVQIDTPDGHRTVDLEEDGSFTAIPGPGGRWQIDEGELCLTRTGEETDCLPLPDDVSAVGDSWTAQGEAGDSARLTLVPAITTRQSRYNPSAEPDYAIDEDTQSSFSIYRETLAAEPEESDLFDDAPAENDYAPEREETNTEPEDYTPQRR